MLSCRIVHGYEVALVQEPATISIQRLELRKVGCVCQCVSMSVWISGVCEGCRVVQGVQCSARGAVREVQYEGCNARGAV
jgi:hypothetical protein